MTLPSLLRITLQALSRLTQAIRFRSACQELETLPDNILKDIGIARTSIHHAVRNGRTEILLVHVSTEIKASRFYPGAEEGEVPPRPKAPHIRVV
jgi:uncharacterized protein YjiS (DUF1127 family)